MNKRDFINQRGFLYKMDLNELTNKKNNLLVSRGNKAIQLSLKKAKELGYEKVYLADQGGWVTYGQYAKKLKFQIKEVKTDKGVINFDNFGENSVILFNDMPSYAFLQNELNVEKMKEKKILTIGDITGSIGTRVCKADILVCSFGENKMINLGQGGVIASDIELDFENSFEGDKIELQEKIDTLPERLEFLREKREEIIKKVGEDNIIKYDEQGINIMTLKKDEILKFCEDNDYVCKTCPMKIKILEDAISIEVQNLTQ